jgi:hypothetical protein
MKVQSRNRIRIKVKSRNFMRMMVEKGTCIRIRIMVIRIRNTARYIIKSVVNTVKAICVHIR